MLTIITPTGERPEAFALCERMMARQTYQGPVRWIIVDDGQSPQAVSFQRDNWTVEVLRPEPFWQPGDNTQGRNLLAALDAIGDPKNVLLTVVEDDDWYAPEWLEKLSVEGKKAELTGEGQAVYYNARYRRYGKLRNYHHTSLRCTAMRDGAITAFREVLALSTRYYDFVLWKRHENKHVFKSDLTVGIKGLPGRPGIATGHAPEWGNPDSEMNRLRQWIGEDADWYEEYYKELPMAEQQTKKMRALKDFKYGERGVIKKGEVFALRSDSEEALFVSCGRAAPEGAEVPKEKPRTLKVQTQEQKLETVTKSEEVEEPTDETEDETKEETKEEAKPVITSTRRRRSTAKKDD